MKRVSLFKYISSLWDTGAISEVRKSIYSRADAVMICFPVNHDTESISEVLKEFVEESRNASKKIFLVGTKTELRNETKDTIQFKHGRELSKELGVQGYFECSSKKDDGSVSEVFRKVAKVASEEPVRRRDLLGEIR